MAEINLKGLCKRYDDTSVIEDLDLSINAEEFMVLVGPSGCGKSTILRMIAGLEELSDGELYIGGRLVNDVHPKDRDVAMVFQSYALYPHMSVRQNIEFGLKIRKTPPDEMDRRVNEAANTLGLAHLLDRKPKALSGGQRQRVALGRAIVRQPKVFLFDEPLSNLDAELRVEMRATISKLQRRLKVTTVYVTHDQVEAMTMGDRICVLRDGEIMQVGTPLELYNSPRNLFVARFIGTPPMNIFECTISEDGESLLTDSFTIPVPNHLKEVAGNQKGRRVLAGIRPENLVIEPTESKDSSKIKVDVELTEPLGHEVILHSTAGNSKFVAALPPAIIPPVGSSLELYLEGEAMHIFDINTEQSLTQEKATQSEE
jgi:multiple sugar transport system ATP-binding protein